MIVKIVPAKKHARGMKSLSDYISDVKNSGAKVESCKFENCSFESYDENINEMLLTQSLNQNTRVKEKTLHIVISFTKDEKPDLKTINAIEEELLGSIGMQKHQRFSALHNNTDNLHLHIAINKVNQDSYKVINPSFSNKKLDSKASYLEKKYSLKTDNHKFSIDEKGNIATKQNQEHKQNNQIANDIEAHSKQDSFLSWINKTAKPDILQILKDKNSSFKDLASMLKNYNLELKERGNGVVIADVEQNLFIKASDIDRGLSKQSLIKRFGENIFNEKATNSATCKYESSSNKLWQEYKQYLADTKEQNAQARQTIKSDGKIEFENLAQLFAKRREIIKSSTMSQKQKFYAYQFLHDERIREQKKLKKEFANKFNTAYQEAKAKSYDEFLLEKANTGDEKAAIVLDNRLNKRIVNEQCNMIGKLKNIVAQNNEAVKKLITKNGENYAKSSKLHKSNTGDVARRKRVFFDNNYSVQKLPNVNVVSDTRQDYQMSLQKSIRNSMGHGIKEQPDNTLRWTDNSRGDSKHIKETHKQAQKANKGFGH